MHYAWNLQLMSRFPFHILYLTEIFSTVNDVHAILEITVYDEDPNKKIEFMGKVAIPLLKIKNDQKRWYALKDEQLLRRVKGRILLEINLFWNPVSAQKCKFIEV